MIIEDNFDDVVDCNADDEKIEVEKYLRLNAETGTDWSLYAAEEKFFSF